MKWRLVFCFQYIFLLDVIKNRIFIFLLCLRSIFSFTATQKFNIFITAILIIMHHKFLRLRLFITATYCLVHKEGSKSLTSLFLFVHLTDVLALCFTCHCSGCSADVPALNDTGICGLSTDVMAFFPAASSGLVFFRFPSVIELSNCAKYVNSSSEHFVISFNLAFLV